MPMSMSITDRVLDSSKTIWGGYGSHPFVMGIAGGTLPVEKFRYFMIQDYLYLQDYIKVFSIGIAKTQDLEILQAFSGYVHHILEEEMAIHRAYMKRLGITEAELKAARMAQDNLSYTSYMLRCAYEGGPAEVCAAILPCGVSYEDLAVAMVQADPRCAEHAFYGEWIRGYADPAYHASNEVLRGILERAAAGYNEQQIAHLIEIAQRCCTYEGMFWDLSWEMRP